MKRYQSQSPLLLDSGDTLPYFQLAYHTYGLLNEDRSNVIWVCHALTANSNIVDWWADMVGPGKPLDSSKYFIVCANCLGSCYGSTGPLSLNPSNGKHYYLDFPTLTIADQVRAFSQLADAIGLRHIQHLIGASMGGQQALEWAAQEPERINRLSLIACNARHSHWGIAFNEAQRMTIEADASWGLRLHNAGEEGLKAARAVALLSYRGYNAYAKTKSKSRTKRAFKDAAASYQRYQGEKLAKRFNAYSYWYLSKAMDSHNLQRNGQSLVERLATVVAETRVVSIDSDLLFPPEEQAFIASHIPDAVLKTIQSPFGHDAFLIEQAAIGGFLQPQPKANNLESIA